MNHFNKETRMCSSSHGSRVFLILLLSAPGWVRSGCPFQNPFWFVEKPIVVPVTDENNQLVPNRVRIMWGRMENFKCVDYFQVEYFERSNPAGTVQMTARINRHRRSVEIEVMPCTEYFFKVIASEDWKGLREDFKMFSEVVSFKLDYTPKFIRPPVVKERYKTGPKTPEEERAELRAQLREQRRLERERARQRQMDPYGKMVADEQGIETTTPSDKSYLIQVRWRLSDIDYPNCLDYFVLDYYDTLYNETGFSRAFTRPFRSDKFELEIQNHVVPCEVDYEFYVRTFGLNGRFTLSYWTPPSCIVTTVPPETTTTTIVTTATVPIVTTEDWSAQMEVVQEENARLQAKIDGLKQEYEKIGLQVFHAFKESFFQGLEDFLARRKSESGSNGLFSNGNGKADNETESLFG